MSRAAPAAALVVIALVSIAGLVWSASGDSGDLQAVQPRVEHLAKRYPLAAAGAFGRRVLVLHAHGERVQGEVFESARSGGGWRLYPATPPGARRMAERLTELATRSIDEFQSMRRLTAATETDLARHAVATVVVEDGKRFVTPPDQMLTGSLSRDAKTGGARVAGAELAWRQTVSPEAEEVATVLDPSDGLWGGAVTIEADAPGTFQFCWPREGARVRVDGEPADPVAGSDDVFVHLELPAGRTRVEVTYVADGARSLVAIAGSAGIVLSLISLLLLFRPRLEHDQVT